MKIKFKTVTDKRYFAENMKEFLRDRGITQQQVAKAVKFSPAYINDIVNKRRAAPLKIKLYLENL